MVKRGKTMRTNRESARGKVTNDISREITLLNNRLKTLEKSLTIIAQELNERINEIDQRFDKEDKEP
jgi:chaperonin cofactor prefoldin